MVERVNVMHQGEIVEADQVERVFYQPQHAYTRELLSAVPRLDRSGPAR
jgi:ABC-type dipeptide/oligopeptide/nickel transport system ATPase component